MRPPGDASEQSSGQLFRTTVGEIEFLALMGASAAFLSGTVICYLFDALLSSDATRDLASNFAASAVHAAGFAVALALRARGKLSVGTTIIAWVVYCVNYFVALLLSVYCTDLPFNPAGEMLMRSLSLVERKAAFLMIVNAALGLAGILATADRDASHVYLVGVVIVLAGILLGAYLLHPSVAGEIFTGSNAAWQSAVVIAGVAGSASALGVCGLARRTRGASRQSRLGP